MPRTRAITLELLRDGPPHNQLLSPLTVYLAKCQNRPAESVRVNIEHGDFLRWQAGLTYARGRRRTSTRDGNGGASEASAGVERRNAISDASKAVTNVLGSLRSLIAELACDPCEWRHIHLILDASELGALPFELAYAGPGFMVEGERLFVQQNARVTLTRQAHRVATSVVTWPSRPRILCIIADGNLPSRAHVLALWQAIDPWIGLNDGEASPQAEDSDAEDDRRDRVLADNRIREAEQMLTVLENPTLDEVSLMVSRYRFTHVHVLAHGAPLPDAGPGQTLYGLLFRGTNAKRDIVDGDRLEAALRHPRDCDHPTVVTLATCEGANLSGAILGPGGSVAHAIHTKGVPLVVASQFPLSKGASVVATEMLYKSLLRGEDPREAMHSIRRELIVAYPDTHDWASFVLYASFAPDLDAQLRRVRMASEKLAAETAVERLRVTLRGHRRSKFLGADMPEELQKRVASDVDRLDRTFAAVRAWTDAKNDVATQIWGYRLLGRLCLRLWDAYVLGSASEDTPGTNRKFTPLHRSVAEHLGRVEKHDFASGQRPVSMYAPDQLLKLAKDSYEAAYFLDSSRAEVWVQVVALSLALKLVEVKPANFQRDLFATRHMAWLLSERMATATTANREERALAAAVDFEAELLAFLTQGLGGKDWQPIEGTDRETAEASMDAAFDKFLVAAAPIAESYRAHAAWKQLRRYEVWAATNDVSLTADPTDRLARISSYRVRLEQLGVRRYWGPRA